VASIASPDLSSIISRGRWATRRITGQVTDITPLMDAIRAMVKIPPDEGGWRTGACRGKQLWVVPNEVNGLTLMFPEDY
jgi:hypothetical protein